MYITLEEIISNGERVAEYLETREQVKLDNNPETIARIETFIGRNRGMLCGEMQYNWAVSFGYMIGQTIIKTYGGEWTYNESMDQWGVMVPSFGWTNPIGNANKCISSESDSINSFFEVIGLSIQKGGLDKLNG